MSFSLSSIAKRYPIDSRMLTIFVLLAVMIFAFVKLASEVMEGDTLAFDRWALQALRSGSNPAVPAGPPWLQAGMIDVTALGGVTILTLITAFSAGYLLVSKKASTALFLIVAIAGGSIVSALLKAGYVRPRPELVAHLVEVHTASFPSGHAMNSAVVYLSLGALLARAEESRLVRIYLLTVSMVLALAIGFSRIYLGVHWPSDVMAGWCVGGAWAMLCSLAARALQRRHKIEQPGASTQGH